MVIFIFYLNVSLFILWSKLNYAKLIQWHFHYSLLWSFRISILFFVNFYVSLFVFASFSFIMLIFKFDCLYIFIKTFKTPFLLALSSLTFTVLFSSIDISTYLSYFPLFIPIFFYIYIFFIFLFGVGYYRFYIITFGLSS